MLGVAAVKAKTFSLALLAFHNTALSLTNLHGLCNSWVEGELFLREWSISPSQELVEADGLFYE